MEQQKLRVALYCRVGRCDDDPTNHNAMQLQKRKLEQFAAEQGIGGLIVYSDNGYSGLNLDRPGFQQLEADILAGKIRAVIAADMSRIARSYILVSGWLDKMEKVGVKPIFVNRPGNDAQLKIRQRLAGEWRKDKKSSRKFSSILTPSHGKPINSKNLISSSRIAS